MLKHNSMMFASRKPLTTQLPPGNPNFGVALRKLRLSQQSMLLEFGGLINAMHIHYIERLRNMSKQLKNAESENSMLLNAAEALEKEALQNNEEKARMMTQYEKVCLDNRQLNRMLEEANKRKGVSNDTNGYDFRGQQRRGIPGPPPAPPAPEQRMERAAPNPPRGEVYGTNGRRGNGRKDGYSNHLGPSVRTLPSSFRVQRSHRHNPVRLPAVARLVRAWAPQVC